MAKLTVKEMVRRANEVIKTHSAQDALKQQDEGSFVLIDIRDIRELGREGTIENAVHVPRGMLEFWFDEESPYHKPILADESKEYVLYCASGWRSALSAETLNKMGFDNVSHVDGGFTALKDAGASLIRKDKS